VKNFHKKDIRIFILAGFLATLLFSCYSRQVTREGIRMSQDKAAGIDFKIAETAYAQDKSDEAIRVLKAILKNYPSSAWADDVHSKLGDIYLANGQYQEATLYYRAVREDFFFSPFKNRAGFRLGVCDYKLENYEEAARTLVAVSSRFTDPVRRLEIYAIIIDSYENSDQMVLALPYYASMYRIYDSHALGEDLQTAYIKFPSKDFAHERVIEIIHQTDDPTILRKIISTYQNFFPAQHALLRLAQLQLAENKSNLAESNLEELLHRFPNDPLTTESRTLLKRLQSRYLVNENHIGVILPLTGRHGKFGRETLRGIELATYLMRDTYPNSKIQFFVKDAQSKSERAAQLVNDLVTDHQVIAIIGPLLPQTSHLAAQEAEKIGVPLITLNFTPSLPNLGSYIFQNALTPKREMKTLVKHVMNLDFEEPGRKGRFAILYPNKSYGIAMRDLFWNEVIEQGGVIAAVAAYDPKDPDFNTEVRKIVGLYYEDARKNEWQQVRLEAKKKGRRVRNAHPKPIIDFGAIFIPDGIKNAAIIPHYFPVYDIKGVIPIGNGLWNHVNFIKRGKQFVQGAIFTDGFFPNSQNPDFRLYVTNYFSAFREEPQRYSTFSFETAQILIELLQDQINHSRESLQQALLDLKDHKGITGTLSFTDNGAIDKKPFLLKVENKRIVEVPFSP